MIRLSLFLLFAFALPCFAQTDGEVSSGGHVFRVSDGSWHLNGQRFNRVSRVGAGYFYTVNGCRYWYPGTTEYQYNLIPAVVVVKKDPFTLTDAQFDAEMIGLYKTEATRDYRSAELARFKQYRRGNNYGSSSSYLSQLTTSGTTLYGVNSVAGYGGNPNPIDVNAQLLHYSQAVNASQQHHTLAVGGLKDLATQTAQAQADLEAQRERYRAAKAILDGPAVVRQNTATATFAATTQPALPDPVQGTIQANVARPASVEQLQTYIVANCAQCHGSNAPKGGLDLSRLFTLAPQEKEVVVAKIVQRLLLPPDDPKSMPRDSADATRPGRRATRQEIGLFLSH